MQLQRFDGGLNTIVRPQFIQPNQGVEYENVDSSVGSLYPVKKPLSLGEAIEEYSVYYVDKNEWVGSDIERSYVEFQRTLYWSDSINKPQKYDGTTTSNIGIEAPGKFNVEVEKILTKPEPKDKLSVSYTGNLPIRQKYPYKISGHADIHKPIIYGLPDGIYYYAVVYTYIKYPEGMSSATYFYANTPWLVGNVIQSNTDKLPVHPNNWPRKTGIKYDIHINVMDNKRNTEDVELTLCREYGGVWYIIDTHLIPAYTDKHTILFSDSYFPIEFFPRLDLSMIGKINAPFEAFPVTPIPEVISWTDLTPSTPIPPPEPPPEPPDVIPWTELTPSTPVPPPEPPPEPPEPPDVIPWTELTPSTIVIPSTDLDPSEPIPVLGGNLNGVYQYVITYYNSGTGVESNHSPVTDELYVKNSAIRLTGFTRSENSDRIRIYRIGGFYSDFVLVATIDDTELDFLDNISDEDVEGSALKNSEGGIPPVGLAFLTSAYAMLFGADGYNLRFTDIGQPENWPEEYFIRFDSFITGLAPVAVGLLVFTRFSTHIVTGNSPETLSTTLLSADQGCINHNSIQVLGGEAIWVSEDGVCASSGNLPIVVTNNLLGKISIFPHSSVIYDGKYYILDDDGTILCLNKGRIEKFNFSGVTGLYKANDKFYCRLNTVLAEMFKGDISKYIFISSEFTEGSFAINKTYKKINIFVKGQIELFVFINGELVQTKSYSNSKVANYTLQIPQNLQRGFYIQFKVKGTGEVSEIAYRIGQ